ncbi:22750_t:CDS:2 [Gigaspora rosea]|nr:22750_t:CDS:2 [Gigaspora rosea]
MSNRLNETIEKIITNKESIKQYNLFENVKEICRGPFGIVRKEAWGDRTVVLKSLNNATNEIFINAIINEKIEDEEIIEYEYDEFKKLKKIGSGAYSSVFRVTINKENAVEVYALKVIENNAEISKEIVNELENMLSLKNHRNIINFYGITKFEGYITIYEKCWQNDSNDRPSISIVSLMLNDIIHSPFQDVPIDGINNDESDFEERTKEYIKYINTILDKTPEINFNDQDSKIIFINELYSNLYETLNKGKSVPKAINNYISENGKSANDVLIWLYLRNEPKYICLRGIFYMWKIGMREKESNPDVFNLFLDSANGNDIIAKYFVGRCYEVGWNTKKNKKEAIKWYQNAIDNGCVTAEWKLGDYYYKCQEYSKAFKLFKTAVDKGNIVALYNLGMCYKKGHGTYEDMTEAFIYLKRAAEMEVPYSAYELARCYEYGKGTTKDLYEASHWYQIATENGQDCRSYREQVTVKIMREISE